MKNAFVKKLLCLNFEVLAIELASVVATVAMVGNPATQFSSRHTRYILN